MMNLSLKCVKILKGIPLVISFYNYLIFRYNNSELEEKYEKKMQVLRDELELRRKTEIHEIEEVGTIQFILHLIFHIDFISVKMLKSTP